MSCDSLNITIYGLDYWPDGTGIAPYTTALAEHLQRVGNAVTVNAGFPYYPRWRLPSEYHRRLRSSEQRNGVAIRRYRQYVPARQSALRRLGFEGSFLANAALSRTPVRPDVVVGVMPALADGLLALATAHRFHAPLVLIIQDLMGSAAEQSGVSGGTRVAAATSALEGWICRQATSIGVVSTGFRDRLVGLGVLGTNIHITRNWSHIGIPETDREKTRALLGLPQDAFISLHAGNMGLKQGLDHVIEAARSAKEAAPNILFVLMGDGNQRADLERKAAGMTNVRFLPPQDDQLFPSILAASDALLVNQLPSVVDMSLPSKLTSYFAVGRPVVASVAARSETAKVVEESRGGIVVDPSSTVELVEALTRLSGDPALAGELGTLGQAYAINHLSAEAALENLRHLIDSACRAAVSSRKECVAA